MTPGTADNRRRPAARTAFLLALALALGATLGACTNTIKGMERDGRKIFGTAGSTPATGQNPTPSNAKQSGWKNPE